MEQNNNLYFFDKTSSTQISVVAQTFSITRNDPWKKWCRRNFL